MNKPISSDTELNEILETRVEERTAQLKSVNQELEAFTYAVSHDLRAPLAKIQMFVSEIIEAEGNCLSSEYLEYLNIVKDTASDTIGLLTSLLELSRLNTKPLNTQPVDLASIAKRIQTNLQQTNPDRMAKFTIMGELWVQGDLMLLTAVMENLLSNAWKFTQNTSDTHIQVGTVTIDGESVFFVKDNGAGFNEHLAEILFRPFERAHNKKEFPGHGVGLSTVQRIIHRHGGRVWAESQIDDGATFFFTIPDPVSSEIMVL